MMEGTTDLAIVSASPTPVRRTRDDLGRSPAPGRPLLDRNAADRMRMHAAVHRLAHAVERPSTPSGSVVRGRDPLPEACRLVGEASGFAVHPAGRTDRIAAAASLEAIALASRVRARRVTLRGDWWSRAGDPFVGYRAEGGAPVALLPTGNGYEVRDPLDGTRTVVTAAVAALLSPSADAFYPSLDDRPLAAIDLLRFGCRGGGRDVLRIVVLSVVVALLGLLTPISTGALFDLILPGGHRTLLLQVGIWLVVVAVAGALCQIVRDFAILRLSGWIQARVEPAIVDRLIELPVGFFQRYLAGELAARVLAIGTVRDALSGPLLSALLSTVFGLFGLVAMFVYEPYLAIVATALLVVLMAAMAVSVRQQLRQHRRLGEQSSRLAGTVLQLIVGIAKLRVAGAESRAFAFWADRFAGQRRLAYQARATANVLGSFLAAYPLAASMVLFGIVATTGLPGRSVGSFLAFNAAFGQVIGAVLSLAQASTEICQAASAYERARPILEACPEVDARRADSGELCGAIDVKGVSFRYHADGPLILDDISLHCRPGELVALVGASGSGKSTLLRLLLGFETPAAGEVLYDGRNLARLDLRAIRRQIGTVLQDGRLLAGDIFTNIVGASALTHDDAWEAARLAGLDSDIRELPMGMHTLVGEGAGTLSGGQRQRLLIARAIAHRPRIVFFDEATSALDNRTQRLVAESLEHVSATRLIIAHRLSTVVNADRIYVLDRGQLVESGTYAELIERHGVFAGLARRQFI